MSISTIPDPLFVNCNKCRYRKPRRVLKKSGRGKETLYYCYLETPPRQLFGQKGCDKGALLIVDKTSHEELRDRHPERYF